VPINTVRLIPGLFLVTLARVSALRAQAAHIGRQPVLGPISPASGSCRRALPSREVAATGIKEFISLQDSLAHRLIGVGTDASGRARFLSAMIYEPHGRRHESESVSISFSETGHLTHGERRGFTTGTPSNRSEDKRGSLLAADTLAARDLARAVLRRCSG